jgi:class 3 adenylate cyclase/tetratricopeptide (TPR) repeat protein
MRCSTCGAENPEGLKFCNECAAPFKRRCPSCGFENTPTAKFCGECATPLNVPPRRLDPANASSPPAVRIAAQVDSQTITDGERKTVTALFADIKGSMELMEDLDPEEARAIVDPALKLMIDAVHRYGGYIVQLTGDGIFALFGAPVAHEDHPERALYAGLRMQEELKRYSDRLRIEGKLPLQARVGVNTGEVVVRSITTGDGHAEYTPIGHSTGLAARMQALAPIGSIAATQQTQKLCEGYFTFKSLAPTTVKGVSEPVNVFEVTGLGPLRTRLQVSAQRGLTKFAGRQAELEQMTHALELARQGHGQIVTAMGEPGVGKSRLFFEFKAVAQSGCRVLEAYSVSHGKASAYLPVIDLLKSYFGITPEDDDRKRREKINGKIITLDRALEDTLPYLFGLLGIIVGDDPLAELDTQLKRRRTLEAIKRILARESINQPLIVEFEDLHWIDSETQALLNLLVDGLATVRILLLVNYRPEYHHQWGNKTYYTQLRLDPLGKESSQEMLNALLGGDDDELSPLKRLIIERTEGNPFFMEEMVQALFEQGVMVRNGAVRLAKPLKDLRVPPTVQAILASRIDRLAAAQKELLQTLAVLGREFPLGLIKRLTAKSDDELEQMLSELRLAEFIYEQPAFPDIEYTFKHALTQEVAYNSVLIERRRLLHERTGQAIEALFADRLEDHLTELANHYDRSGNVRKAFEYLGRAGQRAAQQVAHSEATAYFARALESLKRLPDGADHDRKELDLQIALAWSLFVARGAGAPEREPILIRARELCERLGDNAKLMEVLLALGTFCHWRGEYEPAQELAQRVVALAEQSRTAAILARAHSHLGSLLYMTGQLEQAREHLERSLKFYDPALSGTEVQYEMMNGQTYRNLVLLLLGYPATALRNSRELKDTVRRVSDPVLIARSLALEAPFYMLLRDEQAIVEQSEELFSIATEHGLVFRLAQANFWRSWAMAITGQPCEGVIGMRHAIADLEAFGWKSNQPLLAVAIACLKTRSPEEGLAAVAQAGANVGGAVAAGFEHLKGELLLMRDPSAQAEAERCFRKAIEIAGRQKAKFWELRATTSLARLLNRQRKTEEGRGILADIYNWFTEGFDTADLKDAKALLDELTR